MTAPRTCRRCGAGLSPDVMWCGLCYEPVRQLTPRERQLPTPSDLGPLDPSEVRTDRTRIRVARGTYSRTAGGPTSFGLRGRIALTIGVLLVLAWLASEALLAFLLGGWLLGAMVIKDIWKREYVPADPFDPEGSPPPLRPMPYERLPEAARKRLRRPDADGAPYRVPAPIWLRALYVVGGIAYVVLAVAWRFTNEVVHACLPVSGCLGALVLAVNWLRKV